jgi:hypothetical protein
MIIRQNEEEVGMRIGPVMAAAALLLVACHSAPKPFNATPQGVSYEFEGDQIGAATQQATNYCANQGRVAHLANVGKESDKNIATFTCS